jgi:hypothetical protein
MELLKGSTVLEQALALHKSINRQYAYLYGWLADEKVSIPFFLHTINEKVSTLARANATISQQGGLG